jgi:hypothetical protein
MEVMDEALAGTGSPYTSVAEFIEGSEKAKNSQNFIDELMKANTIDNFPRKSNLKLSRVYRYPQERARHIAISFLFGMVLSEFCGFYASLPEVLNRQDDDEQTKAALSQRMWLITSLSHDTCYSLKSKLSDSNLVFETEYPRFLLTDTYNDPQMASIQNFTEDYPRVFAHNYEQILAYNDYIRQYKDWDPPHEVNDHGILGGVDMFNHLTRNMQDMEARDRAQELALIKACCLTVAQHNIFKSTSEGSDTFYKKLKLYHLLTTSNFRITRETPLLLFLCLVDTIECMKRFSQGATKSSYLQATTILKKIYMYVDKEKIVLDFSRLKDHIDEKDRNVTDNTKKLGPTYQRYLDSLKNFHTWTVFKGQADPDNENIITITLDP